jgi:hypothetical protein
MGSQATNTPGSNVSQGSWKSSPSTTPNVPTTAQKSKEEISHDEAQLYDRQIRLWGLEAQNRLGFFLFT